MTYPSASTYPGPTTYPGIGTPARPIPLEDVYVEIDGVALSNQATTLTLESVAEEYDVTPWDSPMRVYEGGTKETRLTATLWQDYVGVDEMLAALYRSQELFSLVIRPASGGVSLSHPAYSMLAVLSSYDPLAGGAGEGARAEVEFRGDGELTRTTA